MKCFGTIEEMKAGIQAQLGDSKQEELDAFIEVLKEDGHLEYVDKAHHHWELHDMSKGDWRDCLMKMHGEKK